MRNPFFPSQKLFCAFMAFLFTFVMSVSALAAESYTTNTRVNLRRGASTDAAIIRTLEPNVAVLVDDYQPDSWSKVTVNGASGYIKSEYIKPTTEPVVAAAKQEEEAVWRTSTRVNFRKGASTDAAVIRTLNAGVKVEIVSYDADAWSQVKADGVTGYIKSEYLTKGSVSDEAVKVELTPWSEAKSIFKTYTPAKVVDVRTGAVYYVQSFSNGNHADVEPLTKEDTETLYRTFGRRWSWSVRPVWVTVGGHTMAASINGMPHGGGTISGNNMNGQICIHFLNSKTHNGNKSFEKTHQNGVMEAYNAAKR